LVDAEKVEKLLANAGDSTGTRFAECPDRTAPHMPVVVLF
jgi:hypothetical protein